MGLFDIFKKNRKDTYSKGLVSSEGKEGNIILISGYLPDTICISIGIGHYEFCVIGNHIFEYSEGLNFTTIRAYKDAKSAANAMKSEVKRLQSVGYKAEINDLAASHNLQLLKGELALKNNKPKLEKATGDVYAEAGYKPFATVQVLGNDTQYIYIVNDTLVVYEIGKYNTSNIHTYETCELASQGLSDYLTHTKSQGFINFVHIENSVHNALVQNQIR